MSRPKTGKGKTLYIPADKLDAVSVILSDASKTVGVYAIRNTLSQKVYIGSSTNLRKRWLQHRSLLNNGSHPNKGLQKDWNDYGEDAFAFSVLEVVPEIEWLSCREREWIREFKSSNPRKGYNAESFVLRSKRNKAEKDLQEKFLAENISIPAPLKDLWQRQTKEARGFMWTNGYIASKHLLVLFQVLELLEKTFGKKHSSSHLEQGEVQNSSVESALKSIACYFPSKGSNHESS